jgi:hypothetical protein
VLLFILLTVDGGFVVISIDSGNIFTYK